MSGKVVVIKFSTNLRDLTQVLYLYIDLYKLVYIIAMVNRLTFSQHDFLLFGSHCNVCNCCVGWGLVSVVWNVLLLFLIT